MKFCSNCGAQLADDVKFCPACGTNTAENKSEKEEQADSTSTENNGKENTAGTAGSTQADKDIGSKIKNLNNTADSTSEFDKTDIENNKVMALFAYIGILFLIPLLAAKDSKYARYHTNQGIILFITDMAVGLVLSVLGTVAGFIGVIFGLIDISVLTILVTAIFGLLTGIASLVMCALILVLMVLGIYNAYTGKAKELPVIGKFRILK